MTYSFCMKITIFKHYGTGELDGKTVRRPPGGPPNVTVDPNEYVGSENCCENFLEIETELNFCTTYECTDYEALPLSVTRK